MGSCCSCPDKENAPDNHRNKFKVINVDDDGNELGSGIMELTDTELILYTRKRDSVKWHYLCLRRYGYDSNLFSFESGRRCQTGPGIFAFKCARAEELFNMLQEIMQNNSINVVEEPVVERNQHQTEMEVPRTPRTPTKGVRRQPSAFDISLELPLFSHSLSTPAMPNCGDGYLSKSKSNTDIRRFDRDTTGVGMTCRLAAAASSDPELNGEKTEKKRCRGDVAEESPCPHTASGGHLGAVILAGTSPAHSLSMAMEPQPLLANLLHSPSISQCTCRGLQKTPAG
ncbi:UNVERIFIED_CONTAM: hypothetical protein K2H54_001247 [Gekko kuhli]